MRKNKWEIPEAFVNTKKRPKQSIFGFNKTGTLVSYIPKPLKNVILISSLHNSGSVDASTQK